MSASADLCTRRNLIVRRHGTGLGYGANASSPFPSSRRTVFCAFERLRPSRNSRIRAAADQIWRACIRRHGVEHPPPDTQWIGEPRAMCAAVARASAP